VDCFIDVNTAAFTAGMRNWGVERKVNYETPHAFSPVTVKDKFVYFFTSTQIVKSQSFLQHDRSSTAALTTTRSLSTIFFL